MNRALHAPLALAGPTRRAYLLGSAGAVLAALLPACGGDGPPPRFLPAARRSRVQVVRSFPHATDAFTQGLFFHRGQLFESTGLVGRSQMRRVDLETGSVLQRASIEAPFFGEGSVGVGDTLYLLTWRNQQLLTFDATTLARGPSFSYSGEGWGLTFDGTSLVMSDGTSRLRFRDSVRFEEQRSVQVLDGAVPVSEINELEFVEGEILANIWQTEQIVRIDPKTGAVIGWIDASGLLTPGERSGRVDDVLNGIAYDAAAGRLYVTGKRWPRVFEVVVVPA